MTTVATMDPEILSKVADKFAEVLREWLTPAEFEQMKRENEDPNQDPGCCASGDYCDSNMAMDEALRFVLPDYEIVSESQEQVDMWNAAWNLARERHLGERPSKH